MNDLIALGIGLIFGTFIGEWIILCLIAFNNGVLVHKSRLCDDCRRRHFKR